MASSAVASHDRLDSGLVPVLEAPVEAPRSFFLFLYGSCMFSDRVCSLGFGEAATCSIKRLVVKHRVEHPADGGSVGTPRAADQD